jgi:3-oxoacyl-[acyl-carrier-protein] synthase-3
VQKSRIAATGSYLPERLLTNRELERMVDTSDEWIVERTGIRERRIAAKDETTSDIASAAARAALKSAGLKAKDLDLIIVATCTPDMFFPSTACMVQHKIGAHNAAAFDVNAACSGFIYALSTADTYIQADMAKRVLVVGAETLSRFLNWEDRATCVIFGDGGGAVILETSTDESEILYNHIKSDGAYWDYLQIPGGASREPASKSVVEKKSNTIKMRGNETFKIAVKTLENIALETLKKCNVKVSDLALLIPHQANLRIIQATASRLGLPMDKVMVNIDRYGNTSSASIPIALDEAVRMGRIRKGDYLLLEAFGAGLTWASSLIKW